MWRTTYPDEGGGVRRQFTCQFDTQWRPSTLTDGSANPLVKDVLYNAAGQITAIKHLAWVSSGANYYDEQRTYNDRLQLTQQTAVLTIAFGGSLMPVDWEYRYSVTQNNGQITQRQDSYNGTVEEVTYQYDSLNRLISAATTGPTWGLSWSYDGFGNRNTQTVTKGSAPAYSDNINPGNNRSPNLWYDLSGNVTGVPG